MSSVEALITQQREQYNWQSILLGANIGAVHVGNRIWGAADHGDDQ